MKKRISIITTILIFSLIITACGKESKKKNITTESPTNSTKSTTTKDINENKNTSSSDTTADNTDETTTAENTIENNTETTNSAEVNNTNGNTNSNSTNQKNNNSNTTSNSGGGNAVGEKDISKLTQTNSNSSSSEEKKLAQEIINKIITKGMSDFDKAKAIHDYIIMNVDYDYANYLNDTIPARSYTALGALKYKYAVCAGYAKTFQLMCELAGLKCTYIVGDTPRGAHAWNQVKISGKWYNVDVTWDDPISLEKKFDDHKYNSYSYFLISDEIMNKDHTPKGKVEKCSSSLILKAYETAAPWQTSTYTKVSNENDLRAVVKKAMDSNSTTISIMFDTTWKSVNDMRTAVSGMMLEFVAYDYSLRGSYFNIKNTNFCNITYTVSLNNGKYTKQNKITTVDELKTFVKSLATGSVDQRTVAISNSIATDKNFYTVAAWAFDAYDVSMGVSKTQLYISSTATAYHIHAFKNNYHGSHHGNEAYRAKKSSDILTILSQRYTDYKSFRVVYRYGDELGRLSTSDVKAYVEKNLAPTWKNKYCFKSYSIEVDDFVCVMVIKFNVANHNMAGASWEPSPAATCIKGGTNIIKCMDCKNITSTQETQATGVHDTYWVYDTDITKHLACKNCSYTGQTLQQYGQVWGYFDDRQATEFFNGVNKLRETEKYIERDYMGNYVATHDLPQLSWDSKSVNTLRTYAVCLATGAIQGTSTQKLENSGYYENNGTYYIVRAEDFFNTFEKLDLLRNLNFTKASTVHFYYDPDGTGLKIRQITCIVFSN